MHLLSNRNYEDEILLDFNTDKILILKCSYLSALDTMIHQIELELLNNNIPFMENNLIYVQKLRCILGVYNVHCRKRAYIPITEDDNPMGGVSLTEKEIGLCYAVLSLELSHGNRRVNADFNYHYNDLCRLTKEIAYITGFAKYKL